MVRTNLLKYTVFIIVCIGFLNKTFSQKTTTTPDSLEKLLIKEQVDSNKIKLQLELFAFYYMNDSNKENHYLNLVSDLIDNSNTISSEMIYNIGHIYESYRSDYSTALKLYKKATDIAKSQNNFEYINYQSWLGYTLAKTGEFEEGLSQLLNAVETAENKNLKTALPFSYILLAFVYRDAGDFDKADMYFKKSIEASNQINDSTYIHTALHEIGNIYNIKDDMNKAVDYHKQALAIRKNDNDVSHLLYSYHDIALDYEKMDSLQVALNYILKAEKLAKQLNEKWMLFNVFRATSGLYTKLNEFATAEKYLKQSELLANELNMKSVYFNLYNEYYNYYKSTNQYKDALLSHELAIAYKDSVSNEEIQKNISELDKKYDSAKKDKELIKNQESLKRQRIIMLVIIIGSIIASLFTIVFFRLFRQKQEALSKLEKQTHEILLQKEEIESQAEHLEQANIKITNQKNIIEKSHRQITESIDYAKKIQEAVLPRNEIIDMLLPEHFILYMPRDIVSGDFYFIKLIKNHLFIAAADCTGHGIPGGFMSMLSIALLNELVRKPEIENPAQILDEMRDLIKSSLQQTGQFNEQQDGLDIALASINIEDNKLQFAGAHNPLWIFRNSELIELKADTMPVGIYHKEKPFKSNTTILQPNDILYFFTDGYYSQFNHLTNETLKTKRLKDLLSKIHTLKLSDQKQQLEKYFNDWKGNIEQIDDVLVIGVKI